MCAFYPPFDCEVEYLGASKSFRVGPFSPYTELLSNIRQIFGFEQDPGPLLSVISIDSDKETIVECNHDVLGLRCGHKGRYRFSLRPSCTFLFRSASQIQAIERQKISEEEAQRTADYQKMCDQFEKAFPPDAYDFDETRYSAGHKAIREHLRQLNRSFPTDQRILDRAWRRLERLRFKELIYNTPNPFMRDAFGYTPLHHAVNQCPLEVISLLLECGHPVGIVSKGPAMRGETALQILVSSHLDQNPEKEDMKYRKSVVNLLVQYCPDLAFINSQSFSTQHAPLHIAAARGDQSTVLDP